MPGFTSRANKRKAKKLAAANKTTKQTPTTPPPQEPTPVIAPPTPPPEKSVTPSEPKPKIGSKESLVAGASKIGGRSGINWAALDRAAKEENTMNHGSPFPARKKTEEDHSKIYKALNPTKLWKETARERAEAQEDENVIVVQVRGNDARTLLDQTTVTRDDTGAVVVDEDEEEEEELGFGTAMIESGSIGLDEMESILLEKRKEREAEAEKRREMLRQQQLAKDKAEKERVARELAEIEKKEASLLKQIEITEADVARTQAKLDEELEFEEFGFGNL